MMALLNGERVHAVFERRFNDFDIFSLRKETDIAYRSLFAEINGVLFYLLQHHQREALPSDLTKAKLIEMLRQRVGSPKSLEAQHSSVYEALGLDPSIGDRKRDAIAEDRKRREEDGVRRLEESKVRQQQAEVELFRRLADGESVTAEELLRAATTLGVTIAPRTAGTIRQRLVRIQESKATVTSTKTVTKLPVSVWMFYGQVREAAKARLQRG